MGRFPRNGPGLQIAKEALTDADNFGVQFPAGTDLKMKATLLGAVMLIDYMLFEDRGNY